MANKMIEIPFDAIAPKRWEYTIPEGFEAEIKDGKVLLKEKESEDERIREQIEQVLIEHDWSATYKVSKDDCLAYLERQKECVADSSKTSTDEDERIRKELKEAFEAYDIESSWNGIPIRSIFAWLEKQKEQKKDNPLEDFSRGYNAGYYHGITDSEQKPAQTSEEKEYIRTIKGIIADFIRDKQPEDVAYYQRIYDWLDGRHIEHKPAEIDEYEIIKKHITGDSLSSEVNKRLTECGWYVTEQKPVEWSEDWREEDIQTRFAFYTYKDNPSELYLSNVFVEEASRNHGFGTRILKAAEKAAEAIGATTICLKVKQDSPANAWYRKHGYGYVTFQDEYDWLEKKLEYMKPAKSAEWSDEDEKMIQSLILEIGKFAFFAGIESKKLISFFKSLHPQPRQDWSEEDEKILDELLDHCNTENATWYNWLKSLRPSWKPSEEQMGALNALNCHGDLSYVGQQNQLISLYNDLKKLM